MTTPGFLRGVAVGQIIQAMHNGGQGGTWHLHQVTPIDTHTSNLIFKIGVIYPDQADTRRTVSITVQEVEDHPEPIPSVAHSAGSCGHRGHPQVSHHCQTGGVPLSPEYYQQP